MTHEERIQERRAQQRRLDHLAKIRAERTAWIRNRQRADTLRRRAAEQTRALRDQDLVRRQNLERQAERARDSKRQDVRENRSLSAVLEARRARARESQMTAARRERTARLGTPRRDAARPRRRPATKVSRPRVAEREKRFTVPIAQRRKTRRVDRRTEHARRPRDTRPQRVATRTPRAPLRAVISRPAEPRDARRRPIRAGSKQRPRQRGEQPDRTQQQRAALRAQASGARRKAARDNRRERAGVTSKEAQRARRRPALPLPSLRLVYSRESKGPRPQARVAAEGSLAPLEQRDTEGLSWLGTSGNLVVDEDGEALLLRGVNVVGLDHAKLESGQTLSEALALSDSALTILTGLWGVNVVRLPFSARTMLEGTDSLSAQALLSGLDQVVADVASAGAYVLLALQPPALDDVTPPPDDATHECWQLLAARFQDEPGVLYEIYAASAPLAARWPDAANRLIGVVRREHPASLILVSGASAGTGVSDLPLRFATGEPVHDLVYTVRAAPQLAPFSRDPRFRFFAQSYPLVASQWSDSGPDLGRAADLATQLFERYGIGWIAANWNAEPRLVTNATARNYAATRFGNAVRRALGLPVRPQTMPVGAGGRWPSA